MRKIFAAILAILMLLSLAACSGERPQETAPATTTVPEATEVMVGFGAGDVTASWSVGLDGGDNPYDRMSTGIKSNLYIHCLAITDTDGETVLIMSMDAAWGGWEKYIREKIEEEFGIPKDHVIVSAIHQHSTPTHEDKYSNLVREKTVEAVQQALEDQAPAKMLIGTTETEALNFVRRYYANDGKNTLVGDNYNHEIGVQYGYIGHETEADNEMRLIKFERGEDKKPIIMVNFQAHPHMGSAGNDTNQHADWPGVMREALEKELGCYAMYFSGASANINSTSRISEENVSTDWKDHGRRAAAFVKEGLGNLTEANLGNIKVISQKNAYDARGGHQKRNLTIGAIAIGDVVFTYHPYEMFDINGMELRGGTVGNEAYAAEDQLENPYSMTFVCTLANGHLGYVPSILGYTNGGYSANITELNTGSGEALVADYLHLLNELYNAE